MFQAAVIGLGQIGALYDLNPKDDTGVMRSHLGEIMQSDAFNLSFAYDVDQSRYDDIAAKWGLDSSALKRSLNDLDGDIDLIAFATPPADRAAELELATRLNAKVVIFEKPLVNSIEDAKRLIECKQKSGFPGQIYINFHRRFSQQYIELKKTIESLPDRVTCFYAKGLQNYASHHIDLIQHWFGKVIEVQSFGDFAASNLSFFMQTERGIQVDCIGLPDRDYDIFDMHLWFQDQRIDIRSGGVEVSHLKAEKDKYYNGYAHLSPTESVPKVEIITGMAGLYDAVSKTLSNPEVISPACTLEEAVHVASVIDSVNYSAKNAGIKCKVKEYQL